MVAIFGSPFQTKMARRTGRRGSNQSSDYEESGRNFRVAGTNETYNYPDTKNLTQSQR